MAYVLIIAARDRTLEKRRKRHPGRLCRRPLIDGEKLVGNRRYTKQEISPRCALEIDRHVRWGNVRFRQAFGMCNDVDIRKLFPEAFTVPEPGPSLGEAVLKTVKEQLVSEPAPVVSVTRCDPEDNLPLDTGALEDGVTILGPDDEDGLKEAASLFEPEMEEEPSDPVEEEFLMSLRNEDLRGVLSILGGKGKGKSKATLVSDIRTAYASSELDPVQRRRAEERLVELEN